jgi:hypothetical protein
MGRISIFEPKRMMIRASSEMKEDMHKVLNEISMNKQLNEFKEVTSKQLNDLKRIQINS